MTQDEEEEVVIVEETIAAEGSTRNKGAKYYNAEIYLENYERMFQRQDKEHEATLAHVKPLLEILESISSSPSPFVKSIKVSKTSSNEYLVKEFLVDDLKRAIQILLSEKGGCYDFIQTDLQWMMVLNSFTECTLEDETISLNLSDFAYDIDGDQLSWEIESQSAGANFAIISGSQVIISPPNDFFGNSNNEWLNVSDGTTTFSQLLNIEVVSVPDLPVLTLMNVNIIDETAATLAWSVFDNDGAEEHGLEISLDGITQTNLQPSCIVDNSGNSKECVTMLEVPVNRSVTVQVRVSIFDSEFTSAVVEYTIIDFNSTITVIEDTTDEDDGFTASSTLVAAGVLGLIIMVLILMILLRAMRSEPVNTNQLSVDEEVDVVEEELGVDLSPTGLLSRINQNK